MFLDEDGASAVHPGRAGQGSRHDLARFQAGLNARRLTSLRSGWNSLSPAWVTPPQITTTSGLKMLMKLATAAPSSDAVSRTTSSAHASPSLAASYTICAVSFDRSPFTYCASDVSTLDSTPSIARSAIAGPDAYASMQP